MASAMLCGWMMSRVLAPVTLWAPIGSLGPSTWACVGAFAGRGEGLDLARPTELEGDGESIAFVGTLVVVTVIPSNWTVCAIADMPPNATSPAASGSLRTLRITPPYWY